MPARAAVAVALLLVAAAGAPAARAGAAPAARAGAAVVVVAVPRSGLPAPSRDPDEVRRATREVLARPEYRPVGRSPLDVLLEWLLGLFGLLLAALGGTGAGSLVGIGIVLLVVLGVAVLVARFSRGMTRDPEAAAALRGPPRRSAGEWRAEAEAHERAGDWRQAVRCRYRALIADLAARGLVDEVPGRTAGEYRGEVGRAAPAAADAFAGATELLESAWYGRRPTGPDEASRFRALAERVLGRAAA